MGLDLSITGTGMVVYDGDIPTMRRLLHTEKKDGSMHHRISYIACEIAEAVRTYEPDLVGIEGYAFDKKFGGETLAELAGVVKHYLYHEDTPWATKPPQSLKKWTLGGVPQKPKDWPGTQAKWRMHVKQMMIDKAVELGCQTQDDNVADAFHMARWAYDEFSALISEALDLVA